MQRVMVYVDGFNLYFGLRSASWKCYYWLDLRLLAENLLKPNQRLISVRYFSARINAQPESQDKKKRQSIYLEALETLPNLSIYYGHYLAKQQQCKNCKATWDTHEEKMTDVNIAVKLLGDAHDNRFDTAIIISGDSDLTPAVLDIRQRYPNKRVIIAFPPRRVSGQLRSAATGSFVIGRKKFAESQFPNQVNKADGYVLKRPQGWQ